MARKPTQTTVEARTLDHETIANDIAAFRKRGGRIEILGNTPLRKYTPTSFRSNAAQRKPSP